MEAVYDEAVQFQAYTPELQRDIYSNSGELNLSEYSNSTDCIRNCNAFVQRSNERLHTPDHDHDDCISNNGSSTSWDGVACCRDEVIEDLDTEKDGSNDKACDTSWNVKLRHNWKRHLRRKGAANDQKSKKNENRQSIGGSLSRSVEIMSSALFAI